MNYVPILDAFRSGYLDNRFFALAFLYNKDGLIWKIGSDEHDKFFLRSLFKPIQASILDDLSPFSDEEIAIMQASHAGTIRHVKIVSSILNKIGLNVKELLCPPQPPLDNKEKITTFSSIHNNCSGKHAMMLSYCVQNGLDYSNYLDFNHPVQKKILEKLLKYAETKDFITSLDGCTAPVYGISMDAIAKSFLNYYSDLKNKRLIEAYKNNPYIIGGNNRDDTKIMQLSPNIVSKVGAGGFIYVYNFSTKEILIIKMAQDNNLARKIIAIEILYKLGWIFKKDCDTNIYTQNGKIIGEYRLNFETNLT